MKSRIIVAAIGVPLLFVLLFFAPALAFAIFISLLAVIGVNEITVANKNNVGIMTKTASFLTAAALPIWTYYNWGETAAFVWLFVLMAVYCFDAMFCSKNKTSYSDVASYAIASLFIPFFLTALLRIRVMDNGKYLVFLPFVAAFISDGGAYFVGRACGKHKLAPEISPNKTVEGSVGGIISCVVFIVVFAVIIKYAVHIEVNVGLFVLYGILASIAGQLGDLAFSYFKRRFGIKDYGNLLPGHGGVLDRFDSMMFVGPLTAIMLLCLPLVS